MFIQSFRATVMFGALVILAILAFGLATSQAYFIKAALVIAVMSYVTQAISTVDAQLRDQALNAAGWHDQEKSDSLRRAAAIWQRLAMVMWLATALVGLLVVVAVILSGVRA